MTSILISTTSNLNCPVWPQLSHLTMAALNSPHLSPTFCSTKGKNKALGKNKWATKSSRTKAGFEKRVLTAYRIYWKTKQIRFRHSNEAKRKMQRVPRKCIINQWQFCQVMPPSSPPPEKEYSITRFIFLLSHASPLL